MNTPPAPTKLQRLESYLQQDPDNERLIEAAFDEALQSGAGHAAESLLRRAQEIGLKPLEWRRREARWHSSSRRWPEARTVLTELLRHDGQAAQDTTLLHELAELDLRNDDCEAGIAHLAPLVASGLVDRAEHAALQLLWVRLMHRLGRFDDALSWAMTVNAQMQLSAEARGAMALLALDAGTYELSLRWSKSALRERPDQLEASVARASLALAEPNPSLARSLLLAQLQRQTDDGRIWSTLGFTELLDRRIDGARDAFENAVRLLGGHIGTWHGLGWTAISQRDLERAEQAFRSALQIDRTEPETHGSIAVVEAMQGHAEASRTSIDRALGLDPSSLSARYAQALLKHDAMDPASLQRLVDRLLAGRQGPLGTDVLRFLRVATAAR